MVFKMNSGALFGVFDGHNGSECSLYASSHFAECLIDAMNSEENREGHLLESGFKILDERLTLRCKHDVRL
jgi:serine/threonine protein phosphatase PrpC